MSNLTFLIKSISQLSTISFNDFKEQLSASNVSSYLELTYNDGTATTPDFNSYKLPFNYVFGWIVSEFGKIYDYIDAKLSTLSSTLYNYNNQICADLSGGVNSRLKNYVYVNYDSIHQIDEDSGTLRIVTPKLFQSPIIIGTNELQSILTIVGKSEITGDVELDGTLTVEKSTWFKSNLSCRSGNSDPSNPTVTLYAENINSYNIDNEDKIITTNLACTTCPAELTARAAYWS